MKNHIAFDIFIDSSESIEQKIEKDSFYQEIFSKGKILYAK